VVHSTKIVIYLIVIIALNPIIIIALEIQIFIKTTLDKFNVIYVVSAYIANKITIKV